MGRAAVKKAVETIVWLGANNYTVEFAPDSGIAERILWPNGPAEAQGMEDARFVRFTDDDGSVRYLGTYTAFDHAQVVSQLLSTTDFRTFVVSQLSGPFAVDKGMAIFPRKIGGRYAALSRWDRENLAVTFSDNGTEWAESTTLHWARGPWEVVQVGNCGPPVETSQGWLVLTHGVGAMRSYAIGAVLLDLVDPRRVVAALPGPLMVAERGRTRRLCAKRPVLVRCPPAWPDLGPALRAFRQLGRLCPHRRARITRQPGPVLT